MTAGDGCDGVLRVADIGVSEIEMLLRRYGLEIVLHGDDDPITGSYWGAPEAGISGETVHVRSDTPVHSLLHESCHVICMDESRRSNLDTDAGGDDLEEAAVCYLQIVLADHIAGVGSERLMHDMDAWGYSFRLGSTRRWWQDDAGDARGWLVQHKLLGEDGTLVFFLRK